MIGAPVNANHEPDSVLSPEEKAASRSKSRADRRGWRASTLIFANLAMAGVLLVAGDLLCAIWVGADVRAVALSSGAVSVVLAAVALALRIGIVTPLSGFVDILERGGAPAAPIRLDEAARLAAAVERRLAEVRSQERAAAAGREALLSAELATAQQQAARAEASLAVLAPLSEAFARLSRGDLTMRLLNAPIVHPLAARLDQAVEVMGKTILAFSASLGAIQDGAADMKASVESHGDEISKGSVRAEAAVSTLAKHLLAAAEGSAPLSAVAAMAREVSAEASLHAPAAKQGGVNFDEIIQTAQQIAPILALVDEVAFQTNFLALNAGVEAARLGDAGRGIAVVAQELRLLSQRATQAAKQSTGLLMRLVAEAERGSRALSTAAPAYVALADHAAKLVSLLQRAGSEPADQKTATEALGAVAEFVANAKSARDRLIDEVGDEAGSLDGLVGKLSVLVDRFQLSSEPAPKTRASASLVRAFSAQRALPLSTSRPQQPMRGYQNNS
jgi:methyl-accepting chemotaxis protein